jgi:HD-GYP domain-containing protein (c-di-GMP phosphodiesterase class II)/transcriptional regulator with GAF, ATPase, and Fis domain
MLKATIRTSDVVCRIGGEEFAVIMPSCDVADATGFAGRLMDGLATLDFDPAGRMTVSVGIAQGPQHATNPTELVACSEAAMMTAKARGKDVVVLFEDAQSERPEDTGGHRDLRSLAHMKMLQSVAGKLNRLNDVREIGLTITHELRSLIDYHSCRVYIVEGQVLVPIAVRGEFAYEGETPEILYSKIGEGITGRVAETGHSLLIPNATECDFSVSIPGTDEIDESMIGVPLAYGARVIGVVTISKLGLNQFDEDDVRVLEVLAGQASVAVENARLYEAQRREAQNANALLEFADEMSRSSSFNAIAETSVRSTSTLLGSRHVSLWLQKEALGEITCEAHRGYDIPDARRITTRRIAPAAAHEFIADHRAPFVIHPAAGDPYPLETGSVGAPRGIAPLQLADGYIGWLTVIQPDDRDEYFSDELLRLLAGLAYQTSLALQKALLYRAQKESAEISNALLDFSRGLVVSQGLDEVLDRTVELAGRILGSPRTSLWMLDGDSGDMAAQAGWGYKPGEFEELTRLRIPHSIERNPHGGAEPFVVSPEEAALIDGLLVGSKNLSFAVAPIELEGGGAAVLVAGAPVYGTYEFSERKMRLLAGIADQAKLAIDNALSFDNLELTFVSTVEALANALEAKDEYTSAHARSITDMAVAVGQAMGLDSFALKRLELGALFHDIGKIGIRADILMKAGPLTDEERQTMETHPELGEQILAPIDRLKDVRPVVRHCHERWDGAGYPDKLGAEDIPLEARIVFVCDAFHAMTTDRVYRKKLPLAEALRRLRESAGSQFDPEVVDVFMSLIGSSIDFGALEGAAGSLPQPELPWIEGELLTPA